jgi:predicted nucleotidyltransferase component of viral defense system
MKLFEHPDFEQAILRATEHFDSRGLRAAIIEKDYYITEALRLIATSAPDKIIFKGGTSLAKGWNLIQRFSEDIDIFLDPLAFKPRLGKNAIDRELKKLRDTVGGHAALLALSMRCSHCRSPIGTNGTSVKPSRLRCAVQLMQSHNSN